MTEELEHTVQKARALYRENLRQLTLKFYEELGPHLNSADLAQIVMEECTHMACHFVTGGSNWSEDQFLEEVRKVWQFHKARALANPPPALN